MKKIVIFASGSGTNAENIIQYFAAGETGTVVAVFTNNANAKVIERAKKHDVSSVVFSKNELFESENTTKNKYPSTRFDRSCRFFIKIP